MSGQSLIRFSRMLVCQTNRNYGDCVNVTLVDTPDSGPFRMIALADREGS